MVDESIGEQTCRPERRVVILGASNVVIGLSSAIETARLAWGSPAEILAAIGHGRSYGMSTNLLGRGLPGIVQCGLWTALRQRQALPTAALVTDIGNDIIYGCDLGPITRWVETCLERLAQSVDRLVVTRLPIDAIAAVPEWKLRLLASLVFPGSRLNPQKALRHALELDERLLSYAGRFGAYVVQPDATWYSWDPIHVMRRYRPVAWRRYMSCWSDGMPPPLATSSWERWRLLRRARPLNWTRFGIACYHDQPSVQLSDGSTISLY
jgi:hypothetical protein